MPLIKLETINSDCKWALWEITEPIDFFKEQLDLKQESDQLQNIKNDLKKLEKISARLVLKKILESWGELYSGTNYNESGKPVLNNSDYFISISHGKGFCTAIIHKNKEVGIDIELIDEKIQWVAPRVFSEEEIGSDIKNLKKLAVIWSAKETLYKVNSESGLNFKEHIHVYPFEMDKNEGICLGKINFDQKISDYKINYLEYKNFIITYTYQ